MARDRVISNCRMIRLILKHNRSSSSLEDHGLGSASKQRGWPVLPGCQRGQLLPGGCCPVAARRSGTSARRQHVLERGFSSHLVPMVCSCPGTTLARTTVPGRRREALREQRERLPTRLWDLHSASAGDLLLPEDS